VEEGTQLGSEGGTTGNESEESREDIAIVEGGGDGNISELMGT
jgi:hypothetical protein